jgi:hypothetical protein
MTKEIRMTNNEHVIMKTVLFWVLALTLSVTGCSSLRPISSKPPESAIELKAPAKFDGLLYTVTFPPGIYRPLYEDDGGYYFEAPAKVIGHDIASYMLDGGLYVERSTNVPTQWYIIDPHDGMKSMGHCKSLPEHTLIP